MAYQVDFIGLTCFEPLDGEFRRIWMPDGRIPPPDIQDHWASIVIAPGAFRSRSGWLQNEISETQEKFEYFFPPSVLTFPTTQPLPGLETTQLDSWLISLEERDARFQFSANPAFIATAELRHGSVTAFRIPNAELPVGKQQYFARWAVPHAGPGTIMIELTETKGWPVRTLEVAALSEISIVNTSRGGPNPSKPGDHFRLYEQLSGVPVALTTPENHNPSPPLPPFTGLLPPFTSPLPATDTLGCSPVRTDTGP